MGINNGKKRDPRFRKLWEDAGAMARTFQVKFEWYCITKSQIKEARERGVDILASLDQGNCYCMDKCECPIVYEVNEICVINPLILRKMRRNLEKLGWWESDRQDMSLPIFHSGIDCDDFILRLSQLGPVQDLMMKTLTPRKVASVLATQKAIGELQFSEEDLGHGVCPTCLTGAGVMKNCIGDGAAHGGDEFYCYKCCGTFS